MQLMAISKFPIVHGDRAVKSEGSETREAYVYAYVAIGENPSMVEKPENYQNPDADASSNPTEAASN